jgi:hypothetical protein
MKKATRFSSLLLAIMLLTASLSACDWGVNPVPEDGRPSASESFTPHQFGVEDAAYKGAKFGMKPEQVKKILGEPMEEELITRDNFIYGAYISMKYSDVTLTFYDVNEGEEYTFGTVYTDSPEATFTGGLHVGSTKEDVLEVFTHVEDPEPLYFANVEESCGEYIYGEFNSTQFLEFKPKDAIQYAYFNRYGEDIDNYYMMEYYYYNPLDWDEEEESFTGDCYSMVFYVDSETDVVWSIRISYDLAL